MMQPYLSVDTRTVLLLLSLGNAAAAGLLLASGARLRNTPEGIFALAKLLLAPAWLLLTLRGQIPDPLSFGLGNGLLFAGFWLEAASIKALDRPERPTPGLWPGFWKPLLAAVCFGLLAGELVSQSNLRVALSSAVAACCFGLAGWRLLRGAPAPSLLRKALCASYALLCLATILRLLAALAEDGFNLFTSHPGQCLFFALLYTLMFAGSFGLLLVLKERTDQTLQRNATVDELTGAPNRRALLERAGALAAKARREGSLLAALMLDIDHFKQVNDTHGHHVGDMVLRDLARIIQEGLRSYDAYGRFGGEEFVAVLPGLGIEDARRAAERIREAVEASQPSGCEGVRYTVSIGVALAAPHENGAADGLRHLLHRADKAMYEAKRLGRNRVEAAA